MTLKTELERGATAIAREPTPNYAPRVQGPLLSRASPIRARIAYLILRILCLPYKRRWTVRLMRIVRLGGLPTWY